MDKKKTNLTLDFSQPIFVGIDVHKKRWAVTLIHCDQILDRCNLPGEITALGKFLSRYPGFKFHSVYEACFIGFGLHFDLEALGVKNIVVPVNKIPQVSGNKVKTDKRDSLKLATFLSKGLLKSIHIPDPVQIEFRQILRTREQFKRDKKRAYNRLKSLLIQYKICFEEPRLTKKLIHFLSNLEVGETIQLLVNSYIHEIEALDLQIKKLNQEYLKINQQEKYSENYRLLLTIPGVGPLTSASLTYEIGDWLRFKNEKQIAAYFGLTPSEYSSGEHTHRGRITGQGNPNLRALLIEASWGIIQKDIAMRNFFMRLKHQTGSSKKAIVAVARKLVCRMYAMVKSQQEYQLPSAA
ncbi:MAG: IS110 family transposase [Alphaproteobacteria bacterium]|nr:IS110 family transposase [Alphaproteobacteria bacterium]